MDKGKLKETEIIQNYVLTLSNFIIFAKWKISKQRIV